MSSFRALHNLQLADEENVMAGFVLLCGDWQRTPPFLEQQQAALETLTAEALVGVHEQQKLRHFAATVRIASGDGDDDNTNDDLEFGLANLNVRQSSFPSQLPAMALVYQNRHMAASEWIFLNQINFNQVNYQQYNAYQRLSLQLFESVNRYILSETHVLDTRFPYLAPNNSTLRLFVAGDRSSVGKSSVCLGLVGNLQAQNHKLAYIKPATQSESKQIIQEYCESIGIPCRPIGPLVYYRGFTRAFLQGQTKDSHQLLQDCAFAVDMIARGKDIVVLDGVGFPAVGSICGTSNVDVALACRANAVLLVGGPGVGAAVDSYNLNANYFAKLPVIGAVFNKLPTTGYYRLEDCREQVMSYFEQYRPQQRAFGFIPMYEQLKYGIQYVEPFLDMFNAHVDVAGIVQAAREARADNPVVAPIPTRDQKRRKIIPIATRDAIEGAAIRSGAAPSA